MVLKKEIGNHLCLQTLMKGKKLTLNFHMPALENLHILSFNSDNNSVMYYCFPYLMWRKLMIRDLKQFAQYLKRIKFKPESIFFQLSIKPHF